MYTTLLLKADQGMSLYYYYKIIVLEQAFNADSIKIASIK